ncbi:MAG: hypothetical protein AAGA99_03425 [Actinomycetota bacterium]
MEPRGPLRAATYRPQWDSSPADTGRPDSVQPTPPVAGPVPERGDGLVLAAAAVLMLAVLGFIAGGVFWRSDMLAGLVVTPVLVLLTLPLARAAGQACPRFDAGSLVMLGLGAKLLGVQARYYTIEGVYNGLGDSTSYDTWGRELAQQFIELDFTAELQRSLLGTGFLRYLSGLVYVVVGSHQFAAFCVFGFFAFFGVYLMFRAVVLALPEANHLRYGLLVFLWPSLLFWPASVGKESWMLMCLGIAVYGAARVFMIRPGGFLILGLGLGGMVLVRPHVAILVGAAIVPAYLLRRGGGLGPIGPAAKFIGLGVLMVGFALIAAQAERFFGFDELSADTFNETLEQTQAQTTQGGSAYDPVVVRSPIDYPWAVVTVLVRPFPTEADNGQMLFTSLESFVLLTLLVLSIPRLGSIPRLASRRTFIIFAVVYVAMFCFAFAAMGNFGILARQRVQMLPVLFSLLVLPLASRSDEVEAAVDEPGDPITDLQRRRPM